MRTIVYVDSGRGYADACSTALSQGFVHSFDMFKAGEFTHADGRSTCVVFSCGPYRTNEGAAGDEYVDQRENKTVPVTEKAKVWVVAKRA